MKTPTKSDLLPPRRRYPLTLLTLGFGLVLPAATGFSQTLWQGGTSDFNVAGSWNGTYIDGSNNSSPNPNCSNDSGTNNVVLIQPGDVAWYHGDTLAGNANNTSGAYLQTGSTNNTGYSANGNWLRMGIGSGSFGSYVLSNGVVNVAGRTQLGEYGFGYLEVDGGTYNTGYNGNPGIVAGQGDFGPGSGMLVFNGGTINNVNNETWFGADNSTCVGTLIMNGGTFNANNWFVFGRNGGTGYGIMTGGTINFTGGGSFLIGGGGVGSLVQSGGTINAHNGYLVPQSNGGGSGVGTNILSGTAILNVYSWLCVGRGGYGEMDISGNASVTHNAGGTHFDIGAGGSSATGPGVLNQNGGSITDPASDFWLGEVDTATWNLNSGTASVPNVVMSINNGVTSTLNLNGGLLSVGSINSSSSLSISTLNLNGGILQAKNSNPLFITGIFQTFIGAGGATIDSQGYNITIPEALQDNNGGIASVTKLGSGSLILSGANSFGGTMTVSNGLLEVSTASSGGGPVSVSDTAGFGTLVSSANSTLPVASLTIGSATGGTLFFDLGGYGNPATAPLNVAGALTANGTITVNVAATVLSIGTFPLAQYGSLAGTQTFVTGTLPSGVVAHVAVSGNTLELVVTSAGAPRWNGNVTGNWDFATNQDWIDLGTMLPTTYKDGEPLVFDDNATGTTTVNLTVTASPASINFNNNSLPYTIAGTGKISGNVGLNLNGTATVAIENTGGNNFTGPVDIGYGADLIVTNLANGSIASPLGASSASATNLVLDSGTLSYEGAPAAANRGFTIAGTNSTIDAENDFILSGGVSTVNNLSEGGSAFVKVGPAKFTVAGSGNNEFSLNTQSGMNLKAGTLELDGSAGGQTNHTQNELWVGSTAASGAALILTNTTLNVDNWLGLGRINGGINNTSSVTLYNSAMKVGNLSVGWDGGQPNNLASQFLTLNGNSTLTNYGAVNLPEGANSSMTLSVNGTSTFWVQNPFYICLANNTTGAVVVANSGKIVQANGWFDVGQGNNCIASLLVKNNGSLVLDGDMNLADTAGGANATLTVQDNATIQANTLWVGKSTSSTCAATFTGSAVGNFNSYIDLASGGSSTGTLTIGSTNQVGGTVTSGGDMTVGDNGTAVVNMVTNGGGLLTVHGTLYLSRSSQTANGTVNLNAGSTIVAGYVNNGWGFHNNYSSPLDNPNAFNFNGGTLKAYTGSPYFIQPYVNAVIQSGAIIDDGGYNITVLAPLVSGGPGGLTKVGNGTLLLDGVNTYTGPTVVSSGSLALNNGLSPVTVASGATLLGDTGTIGTSYIYSNLTLSAGSTTVMRANPSSNDEFAGLTGVTYGGALVVTNTSGSPLTVGSVFQLFHSATAGVGNFSSVTLLPGGTASFNPTNGLLTILTTPAIKINAPVISGGNLIVTGAGGSPTSGYTLLTTTNLTTPIAGWTTNTTGTFDGSGNFSNSIPVTTTTPAQFFQVRTP